MFETFKATLSPMLVMFACILIGYFARKKNLIADNGATVLSKLENYYFVPALTVNTFMKYCTVTSIKEESVLILYCAVVLALAVVIAQFLSGLFVKNDYYKRNIY